ncbi:leucine-rich repeat protein [Lapidilactobacillus wuchangensis]|uniref:leucine-rich repeat protein n=1 Tax=Lapidilactobacillus wuchangensis TaxID=2486001 RepID=UPI000F7A286B|nr:leucine-rich repeat protein [Lapidilactobacillus wuchangensis]
MRYFKLGSFDCERILLTVILGTTAIGTSHVTRHQVAAAEVAPITALTDQQALSSVLTKDLQPVGNSGGIAGLTKLTQQNSRVQRLATPLVRVAIPTAQEDFTWSYSASTQTATLTGFNTGVDLSTIVIPDTVTYQGATYQVTEIGANAFIGHSSLTNVVIGANVQEIATGAFGYCPQLTSVDFSNNQVLTTIGDNAFAENGLTSLALPETVTTIGYQAFAISNQLTSVTLPASLTSLGANAFIYSKGLTSVAFPAGLQVIPSQAFASCSQLQTVSFPSNSQLTTLGSGAFVYDESLTTFPFPDSLVTIGDQAFLGNKALSSVTFGPNLQTIGKQAFTYDTALVSADFKNATALTTIGDYAFEYASLAGDLVLPTNLKTIGTETFLGNQLTSLTLNTNLTTIGAEAFAYNNLAKTLSVPASVTEIGSGAFKGNQLTKVDILGDQVNMGTDVLMYNRVVDFNAKQIVNNGSIGVQNETTIFTDPAHVAISDLFDINVNGQSQLENKLQISQITNGVTYENNQFVVPTGTTSFSFKWDSPYQGTDLYSGQYHVVLNNPDIKVYDSQVLAGTDWQPADNFDSAQLADGTPLTLAQLTVAIVNPEGQSVETIDTRQTGLYKVTYSYGNDAATANVMVIKRDGTYSVTGTQTETYNGQPQALVNSHFTVNLSDGSTYALVPGDLELVNGGTTATNAGTYQVQLSAAGVAHLASSSADAALYNWTLATNGTGTLVIDKATATYYLTGSENHPYTGQDQLPTKDDYRLMMSTGGTYTGFASTDLISTDETPLLNAGTYPISLSATALTTFMAANDSANYNWTLDVAAQTASYTIAPARVTIAANNASKYGGEPDPKLSAVVTYQNPVSSGTLLNYSLSRTSGETPGTYPIKVDLGENSNYQVTTVPGTFTIIKNQQAISASDYTMYVGDATPTLADFKATATNIAGDPETISMDLSQADFQQPGTYAVALTTGDGQHKTVHLTVLKNQQSITGSDYTMYVGDPEPTITDFKASATNKAGATETVTADLGNVDYQKPGQYAVILYTGDGQTKTVNLHLLANQQSLQVQPYALHVGQTAPTLADFKATATDKTGQAIAITMDLSQVDLKTPGEYPVKFTTSDGQTATTTLTIEATLQSIAGTDYTMYVGDGTPTAADFKASATDVNGDQVGVSVDLSQVNFTEPGSYSVTLKSSDGQTKPVLLHLLANEKSITGQDYTIYAGDLMPTVGDFQASAKDEAGNTLSVTADLSQANVERPGSYPVSLTASDGQTMTVQLHVLTNEMAIQGYDYTMYVGDPMPTAADFHATATDKTGQPLTVSADFAQVDFQTAGTYPVNLMASDGQTKSVNLLLLKSQQKMSAANFTMTIGDPQPTVSDFQAHALDKTGMVIENIQADFSRVNFEQVGHYPVTLTAGDGQTRTVVLSIVAKAVVTPPTTTPGTTTPTTKPTQPSTTMPPTTKSTTKTTETSTLNPKKTGANSPTAAKSTSTSRSKAKMLPETAEQVDHQLTLWGTLLAAIVSLFGLADFRRRKDRD